MVVSSPNFEKLLDRLPASGGGGRKFLPPTPSFRHALARLPVRSRQAKAGTALFFGGIGGRISQSEMRRQKRCCPCPNPPVRGQRQGTP